MIKEIKEKLYAFGGWIKRNVKKVAITLGIIGIASAATITQSITPNEIAWKDFTDSLIFIEYQHKGQKVEDLKNLKGIWEPTEKDFEEVYQYVYGFDMVNWQSINGAERCVKEDGTMWNCIPHWGQEYNNAKERGELKGDIIKGLRKGVRKNEVNADPFKEQPISQEKFNFKKWFSKLFQYAYAGVEFEDHFTGEVSDVTLGTHTPDTAGTGWTSLIDNATPPVQVFWDEETVGVYVIIGGANQGELYEGDDTMSGADYTISIAQINGDTSDDTNLIACRIQDADNFYVLRFNESDADLYDCTTGSCATIDTAEAGIADGSTVELICEGSSISVEDDDAEILSATDATHSSAGKAGLGFGGVDIIETADDFSAQRLDDFVVTVSAAPPTAAPTIEGQIWIIE